MLFDKDVFSPRIAATIDNSRLISTKLKIRPSAPSYPVVTPARTSLSRGVKKDSTINKTDIHAIIVTTFTGLLIFAYLSDYLE